MQSPINQIERFLILGSIENIDKAKNERQIRQIRPRWSKTTLWI